MTKNSCPTPCSHVSMLLAAVILALGLGGAGYMARQGLKEFRSADNFVNVKGLATRDVEADLVIWPIKHAATGNELPETQKSVEDNTQKTIAFLKSQGLSDSDIVQRRLEVTDLLAQSYRPENAQESRFIVAETVVVRTHNIDAVDKAAQNIGELLKLGVSVQRGDANNGAAGNPEYIYTKLNEIKPAMIADATKNAREAAVQFASDSGTHVGKIKDAYQGVFEILPRDSNNSYQERQERFKTVRVVSTIRFYLD
ncbi:MAG: SIMPL domain-containing protein [Alphaproteobacteria bacterium]